MLTVSSQADQRLNTQSLQASASETLARRCCAVRWFAGLHIEVSVNFQPSDFLIACCSVFTAVPLHQRTALSGKLNTNLQMP